MKKSCLAGIIALTFLIMPTFLQAQIINQIEQIKQFVGNWKGDAGKDTTIFWEIKSNNKDDLECNFKYVTNAKTFVEGNQVWGYDKKSDKFILTSATTGFDAGSSALWFISKSKSVIVPVSDMSDPSKATFRLEMEFKTPDIFFQTTIVNNKILKTDIFNRTKN